MQTQENSSIRITVITVAFNALALLKKTMASVEQQDYADIEYIVVDGGSTDGTPQMLAECNGRLTRWVSEPDGGIYDAMNKGVGMATGRYCIFMNAGDTFAAPDVVSKVVSMMSPNDDVVYGDIMKKGVRVVAREPRNCHKMYYCHQSAFVSTQCLRQFPFDVTHRMSADFKQSKQLFLANKTFHHINLVVADYDVTGVSNTSRSKGLWDNIRVIHEVDNLSTQCRLLPRLFFTYLLCRLRGK